MNFLNQKRKITISKLKFKSKQKISPVIQGNEFEEKFDNIDNQNIPIQEENKEGKIFKEFISEKDLIRGLNPEKSYNKFSKIDPLPKEYKVYKKVKKTENEKRHLKRLEKEKKKLSASQQMNQWNFDTKYEKYQKLLTSLPEFNEMPRISGA